MMASDLISELQRLIGLKGDMEVKIAGWAERYDERPASIEEVYEQRAAIVLNTREKPWDAICTRHDIKYLMKTGCPKCLDDDSEKIQVRVRSVCWLY